MAVHRRPDREPRQPRHRVSAPSSGLDAHTVVCDLDGVIWLADHAIAGSADAIARLRASGRRVLFVTNNSSVPVGAVVAKLEGFGIPAKGDVLTSAMAAARLIEPGKKAVVLGGPGVVEALEARGVQPLARRARRRRGRRLPPRLRLRADEGRVRHDPGRRGADRHERRRDLSDAEWSDPRWRSDPRRRRDGLRGGPGRSPGSRIPRWPRSSARRLAMCTC